MARRVPTDSLQRLKLTVPRSTIHHHCFLKPGDKHRRAMWLIPKAVTETGGTRVGRQDARDLDISHTDDNSRNPGQDIKGWITFFIDLFIL